MAAAAWSAVIAAAASSALATKPAAQDADPSCYAAGFPTSVSLTSQSKEATF